MEPAAASAPDRPEGVHGPNAGPEPTEAGRPVSGPPRFRLRAKTRVGDPARNLDEPSQRPFQERLGFFESGAQ
eukprot:11225241-Lingulodinium_polyedra.AAC.1